MPVGQILHACRRRSTGWSSSQRARPCRYRFLSHPLGCNFCGGFGSLTLLGACCRSAPGFLRTLAAFEALGQPTSTSLSGFARIYRLLLGRPASAKNCRSCRKYLRSRCEVPFEIGLFTEATIGRRHGRPNLSFRGLM